MAFSVQDQLKALAASGDAIGIKIQEQQARVADFDANQAALGPALTGDAAVQQQAITADLSRSGLPGFGELKEAISGTSSKTGGTVLSPSAPTATAAEQFFLDRAQRQRSARELDSQLQAFRLQDVNRRTEGTFVGDSVGPALADPLEGVSRDTLLDAIDRQSGTGVFDSAPVQRPGGTEGGSSFAPTGSSFGGGGGSFGGGGSGGGSFGGSGGGEFSGFGGAAGTRNLDVSRSLADFFRGRNLLIDQTVGDLETRGVRNVDTLQGRIPELAAAATVAEGAFGVDIGDDFARALQEAAAVRGLDAGSIAGVGESFNAGLAASAFLGSAAALATQTGFEQLLQAGFAPPQNLNFGTIGSLNMAEAELSAQISANIAQSQTAQALFAQALPGIFSGR